MGWSITIFIQKKHRQNLQVGLLKTDYPFRRKGPELPDPRRGPLVSHRHQPKDQPVNQAHPVLPTHLFLLYRFDAHDDLLEPLLRRELGSVLGPLFPELFKACTP